ncbi:hypothetical protein V6N13_034409 [Hibiscus sabdariffa]
MTGILRYVARQVCLHCRKACGPVFFQAAGKLGMFICCPRQVVIVVPYCGMEGDRSATDAKHMDCWHLVRGHKTHLPSRCLPCLVVLRRSSSSGVLGVEACRIMNHNDSVFPKFERDKWDDNLEIQIWAELGYRLTCHDMGRDVDHLFSSVWA